MKALTFNFRTGLTMSIMFLVYFFSATPSYAQFPWQVDAPNSIYHMGYKVGIGTNVATTRLMVVAPLEEDPLLVQSGVNTNLFAHRNGGVTIGADNRPPENGLKVAEGGTVLFGKDTVGLGSKMMWLPSMSAFRGGEIKGNLTGAWFPTNIGKHSFAYGLDPSAKGLASISLGKETKADGNYSFAAGYGSEATGIRSVALGNHTTAIGRSSVALGKFNVGLTNSLLEIGMGDNETQRENAFTVLSSGKVGVGTTSVPVDYLVAIEGDLICEGIRVELSQNWPDYVFQEDYQLLTLEEIKTHIAQKGHLPGIPAANEMEKEGIDLGDMQVKMMEKIEELTLYILQQEERIKVLEAGLEK